MPLCTIPFNPQEGALLEVFISKPASVYDAEEIEISRRKVSLLIDTGASRTAISTKLIYDMMLLPMSKTKVRLANQTVLANLFQIDLQCQLLDPPLIMADMSVMEFEFANGWRDGVIGRDFLEKVVLEFNSPAKYVKIIV